MQKMILRIACFMLSMMLCHPGLRAQDISKTIQLPQKDLTGKEVIALVEKAHPIQFTYGKEASERLGEKLHFSDTYLSIKQALDVLHKMAGISHSLGNGAVILKADVMPVNDKPAAKRVPGKITGKIIDEGNGQPVVGATIRVGNNGTTTDENGAFSLSLPKGTYTATVSYMGYGTKEVSEIEVKDNETFTLNITLKRQKGQLAGVVIRASARKESVASLYARQKNATSITDGISSEQISRTPDINIGQTLKRISGVTTVGDKYVVVRGMTERYNQAMIDGIVLPSTNMNKRNFSFDVIPQELVSSVVVNKTATPDMSSEFSGGQVIVNTMDIPDQDFTSITIGTGYNTQTTGKDFITMGGRGKNDYLGFDDGRRKEPAGLVSWGFPNQSNVPPPGLPGNNYPIRPGSDGPYSSLDALAQSKRLSADGYNMGWYKGAPDQQYRLAIGRNYNLNDQLKAGFVGGVTYRNQQRTVDFNNVRNQGGGGPGQVITHYMDSVENGGGKSYRFNTTIGALLNMGVEGKNFKLVLRNMYSRIFDDNFNEAYRLNHGGDNLDKYREMFQDPQVTEVWQHKLEGEHRLSKSGLQLAYTGAVTNINQQIQDQRRSTYWHTATISRKEYFQTPNVYNPSRLDDDYDYRMWTNVKETDYNWGLSLTQPFTFLKNKSSVKIGYAGWHKHRTLGLNRMIPYTTTPGLLNIEQPYEVVLDPANMGIGKDQAYYYADLLNGPSFDGTMQNQAIYAMLDQHFFKKLRFVYGVRAEYYNLGNRQEEYIRRRFGSIPDAFALLSTTGEKNWRILPSANLTYSLTPQMNLRAAYSKTAIRPDFRETAYFGFYDYELDANISGKQLVSTIVDNMDLRYEWYPAPGEIISVSGFYKKLKNPIELVLGQPGYYRFQNQFSAVNYGVEMEVRKTLGFIANKQWLRNLTIFGNGTLLTSKVELQTEPLPGENVEPMRLPSQKRPLYGQAPWIINAGVAYQGKALGFSASYNRSGPRSFTIDVDPNRVEYENGRNMLDLQLNARIFHQKAEVKLNLGNLLDEWILFYQNAGAYVGETDPNTAYITYKLVNGTTAYEKDKGDRATYRSRTGRTISLSITYKL